MIAGETRTIETCTDPVEILGRLRLLRRIAYLKLKGYEWHLLRKNVCRDPHIHRNKGILLGILL